MSSALSENQVSLRHLKLSPEQQEAKPPVTFWYLNWRMWIAIMCLSFWICSNQLTELQKLRQEKPCLGFELWHHCATPRLLQPLCECWPDVPPRRSSLVNEASCWSTVSFSARAFTTYFGKCSNLGPQISLWLFGNNMVSKTAILSGKNMAWGEAGSS